MLKYLFLIFAAIWTLVNATPRWVSDASGRKYLIDDSRQYNWMQAWNYCARSGLQLVVLDSQSKNADFVAMLRSTYNKNMNIWLGAEDQINTRETQNRQIFWHATGEPITFSYWTSGNPDNAKKNEHCIKTGENNEYKWNDFPCSEACGFACEENHFLTAYKADLVSKQSKVDKANAQIITQHQEDDNKIKKIQNARNQKIQQIEIEMVSVLEEALTSMRNLIKEKHNLILATQLSADTEVNNLNSQFKKVLEANKNEVNGMLAW